MFVLIPKMPSHLIEPFQTNLDEPPYLGGFATMKNLKCITAAGKDAVPGELLKAGITALAKITTFYKREGQRRLQ